jgi:polar amino acid transport system permease protein
VYAAVALMYFALCWPLSQSAAMLERKFHAAHRH